MDDEIRGKIERFLLSEKIREIKKRGEYFRLRFAYFDIMERQRELNKMLRGDTENRSLIEIPYRNRAGAALYDTQKKCYAGSIGGDSGLTSGGGGGKIKDELQVRDPSYISARGPNEFKKGFSRTNLLNHWYGLFDDQGNELIHSHRGEYEKDHITMERYAEIALDLVQSACNNVGGIDGYKTSEGYIVRYNRKTKDYVKGHPDLGIITMFRASPEYFEKWKKREGI